MYTKHSKVFCVFLACAVSMELFTGCSRYTKVKSDEIILRIANWEEYIDEGGWEKDETIKLDNGKKIIGENSMIKDFESWYAATYNKKVRVEYSTFGTNEDMYNQLTIGDIYDLICPSEYMIMKLMNEGQLQPYSDKFWNTSEKYNYYAEGVSDYIKTRLNELKFKNQAVGKYAACYMWGTLGYLYNPKYVTQEDAKDWNLLINPKYKKRITAKDSVRDCYFAAMGMKTQKQVSSKSFISQKQYNRRLSDLLNDTSEETIDEAGRILSKVKDNVYSFETDSGKSDIVSGKVVANLQWSGDAVYSMQQVEKDGVELCYAVPESSTNLWFDGWCMLKKGIGKDTEKQQAAEAFINFISRPDNVVRNMYYVGYTSAIAGGKNETICDYVKYMYETENKSNSVNYDLNYFFNKRGDEDNKQYIIKADRKMTSGQLYAQYPTKDVIERSVVMAYFGDRANEQISRMWVDTRCFSLLSEK